MRVEIKTYPRGEDNPENYDLQLEGRVTPEMITAWLEEIWRQELCVGTKGSYTKRTGKIVIEFVDKPGEG